MDHFPIFLSTKGPSASFFRRGEPALAKLRLLLKNPSARSASSPRPPRRDTAWADADRLTLHTRALRQWRCAVREIVLMPPNEGRTPRRPHRRTIARAEGGFGQYRPTIFTTALYHACDRGP